MNSGEFKEQDFSRVTSEGYLDPRTECTGHCTNGPDSCSGTQSDVFALCPHSRRGRELCSSAVPPVAGSVTGEGTPCSLEQRCGSMLVHRVVFLCSLKSGRFSKTLSCRNAENVDWLCAGR